MPDTETARCVVCGKVQLVEANEWTGAVVDLGQGITITQQHPDPAEDPPLYWPDGLAVASCPIHGMEQAMAAFSKYPPEFWLEGKPNAGN